eukprot:7858880-Alexandrium_andersonii.AAC.1
MKNKASRQIQRRHGALQTSAPAPRAFLKAQRCAGTMPRCSTGNRSRRLPQVTQSHPEMPSAAPMLVDITRSLLELSGHPQRFPQIPGGV